MNDTSPPVLKLLNLPETIDLSNGSSEVKVTAKAEDNVDGSGVDHITVFFDKNVTFSYGAGNNFDIGGLFGSGTDTFTDGTPTTAGTSFTLTNATAPGIYNVSQVWVKDISGNQVAYTTAQLKALGINTTMTVTGSVADMTAPTLLKLDLPTMVDLSTGSQAVSISAQAKDNVDGSGVDHITVFFDKNVTFSYGAGSNFDIGGLFGSGTDTFIDGTPTTASASFTLTNATAPGIYNVSQVWVKDISGNQIAYTTAQLKALGINTTMTVTGSVADMTAPTLLKLDLPTVVDLSAGSQAVSIFAQAKDNVGGSGMDHITVFFDKNVTFSYGAGNNFDIGGLFGSGTDTFIDGTPTTASASFTLTNATAPGIYNVSQVWVKDISGNQVAYTTTQLKALGINTTMTVTDGTHPASSASIEPAVTSKGIVLSLDSSDWSTSGSNTMTLTLSYDASDSHYSSLAIADGGSSLLSSNVSESGSIGKVTISGSFATAAGVQTALNVLLIPTTTGGALAYSVDALTVNGKQQTLGTGVSGSVYHGSADADVIAHADGLTYIDGGTGIDTAVFAGSKASYTILKTADGFTVDNNKGSISTLAHIEHLTFGDGSLAIDSDGVDGQIYRLYQAAFDRQPDQGGIGYWMSQMEHDASLGDTANAFIASKEFSDLYGTGVSSNVFVTALYQNVLHRVPDSAGYDYWINTLAIVDRASVLVAFSESAENVAQVAGAIDHGFAYTPWV